MKTKGTPPAYLCRSCEPVKQGIRRKINEELGYQRISRKDQLKARIALKISGSRGGRLSSPFKVSMLPTFNYYYHVVIPFIIKDAVKK